MNTSNRSIFNLIEIFTTGKNKIKEIIQPKKYCETHLLEDYYCDQNQIGN